MALSVLPSRGTSQYRSSPHSRGGNSHHQTQADSTELRLTQAASCDVENIEHPWTRSGRYDGVENVSMVLARALNQSTVLGRPDGVSAIAYGGGTTSRGNRKKHKIKNRVKKRIHQPMLRDAPIRKLVDRLGSKDPDECEEAFEKLCKIANKSPAHTQQVFRISGLPFNESEVPRRDAVGTCAHEAAGMVPTATGVTIGGINGVEVDAHSFSSDSDSGEVHDRIDSGGVRDRTRVKAGSFLTCRIRGHDRSRDTRDGAVTAVTSSIRLDHSSLKVTSPNSGQSGHRRNWSDLGNYMSVKFAGNNKDDITDSFSPVGENPKGTVVDREEKLGLEFASTRQSCGKPACGRRHRSEDLASPNAATGVSTGDNSAESPTTNFCGIHFRRVHIRGPSHYRRESNHSPTSSPPSAIGKPVNAISATMSTPAETPPAMKTGPAPIEARESTFQQRRNSSSSNVPKIRAEG